MKLSVREQLVSGLIKASFVIGLLFTIFMIALFIFLFYWSIGNSNLSSDASMGN